MNFCNRLVSWGVSSSALPGCTVVSADHRDDHAVAEDRYDLRRLMQPSAPERAAERKGHVHIYDSHETDEVNTALDENFDRIENMMFTRIHHLPPPAGRWARGGSGGRRRRL